MLDVILNTENYCLKGYFVKRTLMNQNERLYIRIDVVQQ